jgi:CHAT domain-containing protein/tetratricopeptide (TPR) repeat protein
MQTVSREFVMRIYSQFSGVSRVFLLAFFCVCFPSPANPQDKAANNPSIPTELTAADPEIRALLDFENKPCKPGGIQERAEDIQKALQMADSRGLIGDRAIAEAALASALIGEGKLEMAFVAFQKALQDSIDLKNEVLEADILLSLASEAQIKGNNQKAFDLVSRALSISERNANLYEKARALGELGRLKLLMGMVSEAANPIDEALNIDRLNKYRFEAMHLLYRGYYLGLTGNDEKAIESLSEAKTKAILAENAYVFVLAENAYAFALVRKGKADEAIGELELVKKGDLQTLVNQPKERDCITSALGLPVLRIGLLEGLSNALEAANQQEKEIEVWREVFSISHDIGLLAGEAEAAQKIADLSNRLKRTEEALKYYAIARDLYRALQNELFLQQVEGAEARLLLDLKRDREAVPLVESSIAYAQRHNLRPLEFTGYLVLAEIYQPAGDLAGAREVLEKAQAMVHPGPFDSEINNRAVLEAYVRLNEIYKALNLPAQELINIDKAFFVAVHLKDEDAQKNEVAYLDRRLKELRTREVVVESLKNGELAESFIFSIVLYLRDGYPAKPSDDKSNLERMGHLPFEIVHQPGGAKALADVLDQLGPILGLEKVPALVALGRYYITDGADPVLAERYASSAERLLEDAKVGNSPNRVESACILALSYARQAKNAATTEKIAECLNLAQKTNDVQTTTYAEAVNAMVQAQIGNFAATKSSVEKLIAKAPDNSELHVHLAVALASAKLYDEASSRLDYAVQKLMSAGDKKAAAGAYARVSAILNLDSSERAQKLQVGYLNASRRLYKELGAQAEEAEALVVLGDFYLKVVQTKSAIDNYSIALGIAQRLGHSRIEAQALLSLGNAYKAQKDFNRAREFHEEAAIAYRKLSNPGLEEFSLIGLAGDYNELGEADRALSSFLQAKRAAKNAPALNRYFVGYFLGGFYRERGEFEKALASYKEALEITTQAGDFEHSGYSHLAIASVDTVIGDWDDAISESQIALGLFQKIGNKDGQGASWALLTDIYCDRTSTVKSFEKALEYYAKAQEFDYGTTLEFDLIEIYVQTSKYSEAAQIASERIQECLRLGDTNCQANGLLSLSEAQRLSGKLKDSRLALNKARPLVSKSQEIYLRGRLLYAEARLLTSEGKLDEALVSYKQVISLIESIKGNLSAQEQKSISENYGYIYDELVSLLYSMSRRAPGSQSKFASESFEYAEINKARQFGATWGRVFVNEMRLTLPPATQEREQTLYSRRDRLLAQLEATMNNGEPNQAIGKEQLKADLASVQVEIKEFLSRLRKASPHYAAIAYPEETQVSTLPLKKGETLVEFKMTDDSTFAWVIQNRDGIRNDVAAFYKISKKRDWFLDRLSAIRKGLNSGRAGAVDWNMAGELFAELFPADVAKMVSDSQEIIFVPDDVLFVLPFELFSPQASKGNFVFLKKATTYYPSAGSLRLSRTASRQANWQKAFLGIADPITSPEDDRFEVASALKSPENGSGNQAQNPEGEKRSTDPDRLRARGFSFERLPGTAIEVQSIASLLKARNETVDVRSGASATKSELVDTDLSKFRFVHFATHGVLPVDAGIKEPSLVLSYDGVATSHMFLSMSEIIGLKLRSESVVLSACNTGSGQISRAEGVMSLGRAFLAAGSSSVTVSLWQVSDDSTALLMKKYYESLLANKKKSVALAEARNEVFESGSKDPFFWAPFIVIGE